MKVDDVIDGIRAQGRGTLLVHFDDESAYRYVPVHPQDPYLLGIDLALPFGLCSATYIFSSIADFLEWILKHNYGLGF